MTGDPRTLSEITRRRMLAVAGASAAVALMPTLATAGFTEAPSPTVANAFRLPDLPYAESALAPTISAETLALHYGKHHRGYVQKLNDLLAANPRRETSLEELMQATWRRPSDAPVFNNAAQVWNHTFYWNSLTPTDGGGIPSGALGKSIVRDFGSFAAFRTELAEAANSQFGSGWAWLVLRNGKLAVEKTGDAENPMLTGATPLLTIDVWEHAYYIDYRNRRADHVAAVIDRLLNWKFAEDRLGSA